MKVYQTTPSKSNHITFKLRPNFGLCLVAITWVLFSFIYVVKYSSERSLLENYNDEYIESIRRHIDARNVSKGSAAIWPNILQQRAKEFIRVHIKPNTYLSSSTGTNWEDVFKRIEADDVNDHGKGRTISERYCNMSRRVLWEEYIPTLPPALQRALHRQRRLHEAVAEGRLVVKRGDSDKEGSDAQGDYISSFEIKSKAESDEPPIRGPVKVLVWSLSGGLGNRIQSLTSTLIAAMLSNRLILMKDWFTPLPKNTVGAKPFIVKSQRTGDYVLEPLMKLFASTASMASGVGSVYADPKRDGEWPPNRMLLCPFLPIMSLRDFRRKYPGYFSSVRQNTNMGKHTKKQELGELEVASSREDHVKVDIGAQHDRRLVRWPRFICGDLPNRDNNVSRHLREKGNLDTIIGTPPVQSHQALYGSTTHSSSPPPLPFFSETFVYIWSNQYYLPAFYANPHTRGVMMVWLPDPLRAYNVLSKLVALPSLHVMGRVVNMFGGLPSLEGMEGGSGKGGSEKLSVSSGGDSRRSFLVPGEFHSLHVRAFQRNAFLTMAEAFDGCVRNTNKDIQQGNETNNVRNINSHQIEQKLLQTPLFLATLFRPVFDYFIGKYGSNNVITFAPPIDEQGTGKAFTHDIDALTDVIMLSSGKTLFVSPGSTFGLLAAALGDIPPIRVNYHIPMNTNGEGSSSTSSSLSGDQQKRCEVMKTQEPCFGSWYRYDKLAHKSRLSRSTRVADGYPSSVVPMLGCTVHDLPEQSCY